MRFWNKTITILLIHAFLLSSIPTGVIPSASAATPDKASSNIVISAAPDSIIVPKDYGMIKSKFIGKGDKLIVHIQDAHCNYEAQSNIANIIENMVKNNGLSLVSVEGADGMIDTSWFKAFPDAEVRKEVANYFMKKGEITGPEFLSITTDYPIKLFGAETREYYIQNLNAFTASYPLKGETEKYLNNIKSALIKLQGLIYNADLKAMSAKSNDYETKKMQFNDYVRFLQDKAERHKINLRQYDDLFKLVNVLIYEKKIDFNVTDKERSSLIDELSKAVSKDILTELVNKSIAFKVNKISAAEYYAYVRALAQANKIDLMTKYPNLFNYIIYNAVYSRINNEGLFNDIKKLEMAIKEKLFENEDQRTLERLSRHIDTLIGLVNIKLLNGDFDYYKAHKDEFTPEVFSDFIKAKSIQFGLAYEIDSPADAVANNIFKLEDFYAIAIKRDKAMVDNTLEALKKTDQKIAVLVTGGFHSEGMMKLLEKEGISYVVVCPSITKDVPTPYIQILMNQRTSFEDILTTPKEPAKKNVLAPALETWGQNLPTDLFQHLLQQAPILQGGNFENFSDDWIKKYIETWLKVRIAFANSGHVPDAEVFKDAFRMDFRRSAEDVHMSGDKIEATLEIIINHPEFDDFYHSNRASTPGVTSVVPVTLAPAPTEPTGEQDGNAIRLRGDGKGLNNRTEHGARRWRAEGDSDNRPVILPAEDTVNGVIRSLIIRNQAFSLLGYKPNVVGGDKVINAWPLPDQISAAKYYELKRVMEKMYKNLIIIRGLRASLPAQIADLILHPGVTRNSIYIDEDDFLYLLSLDNGIQLVLEAVNHEATHIAYPKLDEKTIEDMASTANVRTAFEKLAIINLIKSAMDSYENIVGHQGRNAGYDLSLKRLKSEQNILEIISDGVLSNDERAMVAKLMAFGKGSIFSFWKDLTADEKRVLIDQVRMLDLDQIERYYQVFIIKNGQSTELNISDDSLSAPVVSDIRMGDIGKNIEAKRLGDKAFDNHEVAFLELAGGSGARLGYDHAKIMFKTRLVQHKSLGQMRAEALAALSAAHRGNPMPWLIMTSDVTDKETKAYFAANKKAGKYFGLIPEGWVKIVRQRVLPQVTDSGEFVLESKNKIVVGGFGHGDARDFILSSPKVIKWLQGFGIKYVMMLNVDNAFVASSKSIGYHIKSGEGLRPGTEHVSVLVVEKDRPEERVGMAVLIKDKDSMVEYNQIPPNLAYLPYVYVIGEEKVIFYKYIDGRSGKKLYRMATLKQFKENLSGKTPAEVADYVTNNCVSLTDIPDDFETSLLGNEYTKEILRNNAVLWLRLANLNTLIWSLSSFTDKEHPLKKLPVMVARGKTASGYQPETGEYSTKLRTNKFEIMAFHGFQVGTMKGAHILVGRAGEGKEGGFAPIKEKTGVDTPERAAEIMSNYNASLLEEHGWFVSPEALVELSPAFAFLDGSALEKNILGAGTVHQKARLYLSGAFTTVGKGLNIVAGKQFIVRVDEEYNPNAQVQIGKNVSINESVSFEIKGGGVLVIDDEVILNESNNAYVIGEGEILHITKKLTEDQRNDMISKEAYALYAKRGYVPGDDKDDWARATEMVEEKYPSRDVVKPMSRQNMLLQRSYAISRVNDQGSPEENWKMAVKQIDTELHLRPAPSVGAIRGNKGGLSGVEHGARAGDIVPLDVNTVNGIIHERVDSGNAYSLLPYSTREGDIIIPTQNPPLTTPVQRNNYGIFLEQLKTLGMVDMQVVVIKGLRDELIRRGIAPDLMLHYGVTRQTAYIDEEDLLTLLSNSKDLELPGKEGVYGSPSRAIYHENIHIENIKNPDMNEAEVQKIAPIDDIRLTLSTNVHLAALRHTLEMDSVAYTSQMADELKHDLLTARISGTALGNKHLIILQDTMLDPEETRVAQEAGVAIEKYLGDKVIALRGMADNLIARGTEKYIELVKTYGPENVAIIAMTASVDKNTSFKSEDQLNKLKALINSNKKDDISLDDGRGLSVILKVDDSQGAMSNIALYDTAIALGFNLGQERILRCLNNIALTDEGKPFDPGAINDRIKSGVFTLKPIIPIDENAVDEVRRAEVQALRSL